MLPAQKQSEPPPLGEVRQKIEDANQQGLGALQDLRKYLFDACQDNPDAVAVHELAAMTFLAWCRDPQHLAKAAPPAAAFAKSFGDAVLVAEDDPQRALTVLEAVWPYRDSAGYRACELALTLADAYRVAGDYAGSQHALDYYDGLRQTADWQAWREDAVKGPSLPFHDMHHERARAMLESFLGNPDAVLYHLRRASAMLAGAEPTAHLAWPGVWQAADLGLQLDRINCYCNLENFGRAASYADEVLARARAAGRDDTHLRLYRALARSWDPAASAQAVDDAASELEVLAGDASPVVRKHALRRLLEWASARDDEQQAVELLAKLRALGGDLSYAEISLQTELLLRRDARSPCPSEQLLLQKSAQRAAFDDLLARWQRTPLRAGGNGFLHYIDRRETIGQLVSITLRAATAAGEPPPQAAVAEALQYVMAAQTHSLLAHRLGAGVPSSDDLTEFLQPGEGIVLFLPARKRSHVFAVDRGGVRHCSLDHGAFALRADIQLFLEALDRATDRLDHSSEQAAKLAAELHEIGARLADVLLPASLREQLASWERLTVIGAELLHGPPSGSADAGFANHLPLECLPWQERLTLGERFAIDHNASLPVWWQLAAKAVPTGRRSQLRVLGVLTSAAAVTEGAQRAIADGDRLATGWGKQVGAAFEQPERLFDESCCVHSVAKRSPVDVATGTTANQPAQASIAVFLVHGGYDGSSERGAYLQLYDGRLDCVGTEALGEPGAPFADIVVLAACRAAKGPTRAGDSMANLGGAFLLAGATAVVQSRFDLPLWRTQALLDELLVRLANGESCAAAMQAARVASARSDDDPLAVYRAGVLQVYGYGQSAARR